MDRKPSRDDSSERGRSSRDDSPRRGSREEEPSRGRGRDEEPSRGRGRDDSRSGRGGGFEYKKRDVAEAAKRASQGGKDFDVYVRSDVKTFSPNNGANTIRVLPPTWDVPKHYGIDIWVHYSVGPDSQSYLCLHKMKSEPCPICDELTRARRDREDEDYIKNLESTKRVLFYMVDRDNEKDGVQAWASPWTIDRDITKVSIDRKTGDVLPIDDPEDGYDVEFDRTGKGVGTKYVGLAISRRSSALGSNAWLDFAVDNPLPTILEYYSYDHIQKAFGGGAPAPRDGDRDTRDSGGSRSDRDRPSEQRDDRDRGRPSREEPSRERGRSSREEPPALTWDSVHALEGTKLDDLIEAEKLKLDPNKFDSDEALADAICEDLGLKQEAKGGGGGRDDTEGGGRLEEMRRRREAR